MSLSLITGALAIAAITLVQGAGVAEAAPNGSDGTKPNTNQDIIAQGAGNLAALFRGIPMGARSVRPLST